MLTHDLNHLNLLIVKHLHKIRAIPFDVVVHIPRSGTIPASLIATYLSKPFASVDEFCNRIVNTRKGEFETLHRILLVDDSIRTGKQMAQNINKILQYRSDAEIRTLAVYSTKYERQLKPTLHLHEHEECDYIYPWFMWKTKRIGQCAVDMDGVFCRDCEREEDDDGENYQKFLETAAPRFKTRFPIGAIVTSRLEKYRAQTERWLKQHGLEYGELIMGPWCSKDERRGKQAAWKAEIFKNSKFLLFIESSEKEAIDIARISGKPVWCTDTQRRYG